MRATTVLLVLGLGACGEGGKGKDGDGSSEPVDADGDGYGSVETGGDDCDDADADIHPGAVEDCDGIDNDCDGLTDLEDADVVGWGTWYVDSDGDGYGTEEQSANGCEQPDNTTEVGGDCDDRDDDVNPDAREVCDGEDNDCDGLVDTDDDELIDARTMHEDADGDGYGNADVSWSGCEFPSGVVADDTDCDDADADIHPDAPETCADGIDSDCDDWDGPSSLDGATTLDCAQYAIDGDDGVGVALAAAGDDISSFLVGSNDGRAWLFTGPLSGPADLPAASAVLEGDADAGFGQVLALGQDLDGDGESELLLGAPGADTAAEDAGAAYVFAGPATGTLTVGDALASVAGSSYDDQAGAAMAGGSDLDGDGVADLLVGAPQVAVTTNRTGAVYLLSGPLSAAISVDEATASFTGDRLADWLGAGLDLAGDVDGDGYDDVLATAPKDDSNGESAGAVYVLQGPATAGGWSGTVRLLGVDAGDGAGTSVAAAGDLDDDGYADLLVGAPDNDDGAQAGGAVYVWLGPVTGETSLENAAAVVYGASNGDNLGQSVAAVGDVDGDGEIDLLLGAPREDWNPGPGGAWLAAGPLTGLVDIDDVAIEIAGIAQGDQAGWAVTGPGDLDGDDKADLVVGAPGYAGGVGGAWILLGGAW